MVPEPAVRQSAPSPFDRRVCSNAIGGLMLRAGRLDEAIAHVNEGIATAGQKEVPPEVKEIPTHWADLAMAYARKGNLAEARRAIERLRASHPESSASFWELQELELLRGEAESLLLDAGFPSDPFRSPRSR